jgi:hypothetical protein
MNIRLGIYEIFSRIVPGGLYIAAIAQFASILGLVTLNLSIINNLSIITSTALIVIAYILGGAFDIFSLAWFQVFRKPGLSSRLFAEFKKSHDDEWMINFQDKDWRSILAYIRTRDIELAGEIDRQNAVSIMLRNVSVGLLLFAVNSLIQFVLTRNSISIYVCVAMLALSLLIIRESVKFREWFYRDIFETILAYRINLEEAITPVGVSPRQNKSKKQEGQ